MPLVSRQTYLFVFGIGAFLISAMASLCFIYKTGLLMFI